MLSASAGWLSSRYRSAFRRAASMPSGWMRFSAYSMDGSARAVPSREPPPRTPHGVVEVVHHALLERDDRVVGDVDRLGADLGAALGDVAVADARLLPE